MKTTHPILIHIISHSSQDAIKKKLRKYLAPLDILFNVEITKDPLASDVVEEYNFAALNNAQIAITLLSHDLLADHDLTEQLLYSAALHEEKKAISLFVLAEQCFWYSLEKLRQFEILPIDGGSIENHPKPSLAYMEIVITVQAALQIITLTIENSVLKAKLKALEKNKNEHRH